MALRTRPAASARILFVTEVSRQNLTQIPHHGHLGHPSPSQDGASSAPQRSLTPLTSPPRADLPCRGLAR
jgi:hypothetical protein